LTRNNSGVSAPRASASPESAPAFRALGVVTADGGLTIPPAVLDRMAAEQRATNRARYVALGTRAAQIDTLPEPERSYAAAELAVAACTRPADEVMNRIRERGGVDPGFWQRLDEAHAKIAASNDQAERELTAKHGPALRLVPPPGPVQPATPCPSWCVVGDSHETGDLYHFGDSKQAGPVSHYLDIDDDGAPNVAIGFGCDPEHLDLDEVDALIAGLTARRAELAELLAGPYAPQAAFRPTGGAA
jgi:hypothetical protein